ncbi:MAG TPA: acyl carrier protein phosphodiesterase, partial [Bacteroidia bacterium]
PGELMVGNFIADSVKGSAVTTFSEGIQQGIKLHRAIDNFTDNHAEMLKSKKRLRPRYKKYAPVISDIFYDHFLAVSWQDYSTVSLRDYTQQVYEYLGKHYSVFPERSKQFYNYMTKYDILFAYTELEGIEKVMQGMSRRASFISGMENATNELQEGYADFKTEFQSFFPDLQQHVYLFQKIN